MSTEDIDLDIDSNQEELFEHHRVVADKGQSLIRVDKFLTNRLEGVSRNRIQVAASANCILVNNVPVKPSYKVKPEDVVTVVMSQPPRELEIIAQDLPLNIVYQDEHLAVINKEPGMVVHPGHGNYTGTLVNAMAHHFSSSPLFKKGEERPGLVHRIDKNTSGIIVVAKDEISLNNLARQFFDRTTKRKYIALVWGNMEEDEGTITGNIGRSLKNRLKMDVFPDGETGKHAVTHYKVLERLGYVNLVECRLETGRTHQIRVHFEHIGHPLFNDERYGGDSILKGTTFTKYKQFVMNCFKELPRHALHAKSLGFTHPITGKEMLFDSDLPEDMTKVIEKWRNYTSNRFAIDNDDN
ncbi:MAG: RluA family pseudouridine synthase [Bacteroidales bacterium]|nr:RluA family pseudouridine synthase [Bacteroidales bacterium]